MQWIVKGSIMDKLNGWTNIFEINIHMLLPVIIPHSNSKYFSCCDIPITEDILFSGLVNGISFTVEFQ